jgi:diaminohydroxyphosphoribosylaminopyrimidine deaminase/5-amino-6-(5-phosphoribosylamino)uracil reductase
LLKWAQTQDGFIDRKRTSADEPPLLISNNITLQLTHKMRSENQAILVGTNTVLLDNPSLTVRYWPGKSPIRIAIDRQGRIPSNYILFDKSAPTIIFTEKEMPSYHPNVEFVKIDFNAESLQTILRNIYERNIHSVLVEGGSQLINSFLTTGLWDEANVEISSLSISDGVPAPELSMHSFTRKTFEGHEWLCFKRKK